MEQRSYNYFSRELEIERRVQKSTKLLGWLFQPGKSLSSRVIKGGIWTFALGVVSRVLRVTRTVILARLIAPSDFGLFGVALLAISTLESFSQTGLDAALVQKRGDVGKYLDTVWTVQAIRGFLLASLLFVSAPYCAQFFDSPASKPVFQVVAFSFLLRGLANVGVIYFRKELEFHKQFVYVSSTVIVDLAVSISMAVVLRSAWALVFGLLARSCAETIMSYVLHPHRPRPRFRTEEFWTLFSFGKWILGSNVLVFMLNHGDDLLVAKLLGLNSLGLYQMAYKIANLPATEITHVISQVSFSGYSKLQDQLGRLRKAYLDTLQITAAISLPIAGMIFLFAPDFTGLFLGQAWMAMVPTMQLLALWGFLRSISATTGPLFQAVGRPEIATKLQLRRLVIMVLLAPPMTMSYGMLGAGLAVIVSAIAVDPIAVYKVSRVLRCPIGELIKLLVIPALGTVATVVLLCGLRQILVGSLLLSLVLPVIAGILSYMIFHLIVEKVCQDYRIGHMLKERFSRV